MKKKLALASKKKLVILFTTKTTHHLALINEIASSTGNHSLKYFNSDLSIIKNLDDLSTQIKKEYDSIDILVNNAGAYFSKYIKTENENLAIVYILFQNPTITPSGRKVT